MAVLHSDRFPLDTTRGIRAYLRRHSFSKRAKMFFYQSHDLERDGFPMNCTSAWMPRSTCSANDPIIELKRTNTSSRVCNTCFFSMLVIDVATQRGEHHSSTAPFDLNLLDSFPRQQITVTFGRFISQIGNLRDSTLELGGSPNLPLVRQSNTNFRPVTTILLYLNCDRLY